MASGQSRRLATKKAHATNAVPDIVYEASQPTFDLKKASKAAPNIPWNDIVPSFNLDSRKLRRYIIEDVMYSNLRLGNVYFCWYVCSPPTLDQLF